MQIVWFKRDLRIHDHAALWGAYTCGPVIPLYIFEPELWAQPDMSHRQFMFLSASVQQLNHALTRLGQPLIIRTGHALDILATIIKDYQVHSLWSHQETWNDWTYQRDISICNYLKVQGIDWHEPRQSGVIRRLKSRHNWAGRWYDFMTQPISPTPTALTPVAIDSESLPNPTTFNLQPDGCRYPQQGGRQMGLQLLNSFLYQRGEFYQGQMSSPLTAFDVCSRLSPHIAFGTLSMREIFHALEQRITNNKQSGYGHPINWQRSLTAFKSRLFWHCHFIQKMEDEPQIEFDNMHASYDHLKRQEINTVHYQAWTQGQTGYPFIDACMRALIATGWINFRMRAMLMSFASHHLWLDWRHTAAYLAALFTDYEPGIHYPQCQMQSGTTGINSLRIYNPIKQSEDQDPQGLFIRRWVPELVDVPTQFIHQPWLSNHHTDYPSPIIDEKQARDFAVQANHELRRTFEHKDRSRQVLAKHANQSTSSSHRRLKRTKKSKNQTIKQDQPMADPQIDFNFILNLDDREPN